MATQEYKIKVEYGVSAIVLLIGAFFIFQAFTIETSREAVGPRTMPLYLAVALVLGGLWLAIGALSGGGGKKKRRPAPKPKRRRPAPKPKRRPAPKPKPKRR